jgi:hypothetical protein
VTPDGTVQVGLAGAGGGVVRAAALVLGDGRAVLVGVVVVGLVVVGVVVVVVVVVGDALGEVTGGVLDVAGAPASSPPPHPVRSTRPSTAAYRCTTRLTGRSAGSREPTRGHPTGAPGW